MVTEYKVTTGFTIEVSGMTHVGGNRERVSVADKSLDVLLDSLEKKGVIVHTESSQKKVVYDFQGKRREELVPFGASYPEERIIGYELQTPGMDIIVHEYHTSHGLGGRGVIGGPVEYKNGISVEMKYKGNTLTGIEERCTKVKEAFKELYDPYVRAHNEWLAKMTPEERGVHDKRMKELDEGLLGNKKKGEEGVDSGQKATGAQLLEGSPADEPMYQIGFDEK